jgi:uncharacterized protein (DUF983 family)
VLEDSRAVGHRHRRRRRLEDLPGWVLLVIIGVMLAGEVVWCVVFTYIALWLRGF